MFRLRPARMIRESIVLIQEKIIFLEFNCKPWHNEATFQLNKQG